MLCRILRLNPHRGGVASRPGHEEKEPEAQQAEEPAVTESPGESLEEQGDGSAAPGV